MRAAATSALVGVAAFALATITFYVGLVGYYVLFDGVWPSGGAARQSLGALATTVTFLASAAVLLGVPWLAAARWRTNLWIAVLCGGALVGVVLPFLVVYITWINCQLDIPFPPFYRLLGAQTACGE